MEEEFTLHMSKEEDRGSEEKWLLWGMALKSRVKRLEVGFHSGTRGWQGRGLALASRWEVGSQKESDFWALACSAQAFGGPRVCDGPGHPKGQIQSQFCL